MSNRPAIVCQADVKRAIKACIAAGQTVYGVIVNPDGVKVLTQPENGDTEAADVVPRQKVVL